MPLQWTQALSVGIPEIDAQHQELFRRVDRLLAATLADDHGETGAMLAFLGEYVEVHFATEERFMQEVAYPGLERHRGEHERFVADLRALHRDFAGGGAFPGLVGRLNRQIGDWLRGHVCVTDLALGRFASRARQPRGPA
jgi:hemerythrin